MENVLLLAAAATSVTKLAVDALRLVTPLPSWLPLLLAFLIGPLIVTLLVLVDGQSLNTQTIAQAILAGLMAGGGAAGVTEMHKQSRAKEAGEKWRMPLE
jgi:hypothetical protein